eukprot:358826-Chlamydomonas_euryale.AAC.1
MTVARHAPRPMQELRPIAQRCAQSRLYGGKRASHGSRLVSSSLPHVRYSVGGARNEACMQVSQAEAAQAKLDACVLRRLQLGL